MNEDRHGEPVAEPKPQNEIGQPMAEFEPEPQFEPELEPEFEPEQEPEFDPEFEPEPELESPLAGESSSILPSLPKQKSGLAGQITVRGLAEGAMMTAITLILAITSVYVPILGFIAPLLFPAPLALLVLRHGLRLGILSAASAFFLSTMLLGLPSALYMFIMFGFLGLFFGSCFRMQKKASFTLVGGVLISLFAIVLSLIFPTFVAGISVSQYLEMSSSMLNEHVSMLQQQSANPDLVMGGMSPAAYVAYMEDMMRRLLPSLFACSAMGFTMLCYVMLCRLLRRFGYDVGKLPPFKLWRLDWRFLWGLIVALALAGLGQRLGLDLMARIGDNLLVAFSPILMICGVSLLVWLLARWKVAAFVKVLLVLFAFQILGGALNILVLIGVFDPIFDFRRRIELLAEKKKMGR